MAIVTIALAVPALAEVRRFGPFSVDDSQPTVVRLDGDIDAGAALNFRRALAAAPDAELLVLKSPGGLVPMARLIADDVHSRKLATLIPDGPGCYSACSLIFLAGDERQVDGELGVHQISSDPGDLVSAQYSISDILDVLNRFETPIEVLTVMFKTPSDEMYVFSAVEIERYEINRRHGEAREPEAVTSIEPAQTDAEATSSKTESPAIVELERPTPSLGSASASRLSAIEDYARRPNGLALYTGLDFFGEDVASRRVASAPACAAECLTFGDQCKAFTFNTDIAQCEGPTAS